VEEREQQQLELRDGEQHLAVATDPDREHEGGEQRHARPEEEHVDQHVDQAGVQGVDRQVDADVARVVEAEEGVLPRNAICSNGWLK